MSIMGPHLMSVFGVYSTNTVKQAPEGGTGNVYLDLVGQDETCHLVLFPINMKKPSSSVLTSAVCKYIIQCGNLWSI